MWVSNSEKRLIAAFREGLQEGVRREREDEGPEETRLREERVAEASRRRLERAHEWRRSKDAEEEKERVKKERERLKKERVMKAKLTRERMEREQKRESMENMMTMVMILSTRIEGELARTVATAPPVLVEEVDLTLDEDDE